MTTMPQRESTIAAPDDGRKQLGAFLRARRESLDPQRLGLPRVVLYPVTFFSTLG